MQLSAVLLARAIGFVETSDLNPRGRVFFPAIVPLIVERFSFQKYPSKPDDFDESKGVNFEAGYAFETSIDKLTVWANGIGVDVRSSTADAKKLLEQTLVWLKEETGLRYESGMLKRWAFLSQITFYSRANFNAINPAISRLASRLSAEVSTERGERFDFQFGGFSLAFDRSVKQAPVANLLIQPRADTPFSEGKYFSEAPLSTESHIKLIEDFEKDLATTQ